MNTTLYRFRFSFLFLLLALPSVAHGLDDLEASLVPSVTLISAGEENVPLFSMSLTNRSSGRFDIRQFALDNTGSASVKAGLSGLQLYSNGDIISRRHQVFEEWDPVDTKRITSSKVRFWIDSLLIDPGETVNIDLRANIDAGIIGLDYRFDIDSVSVKLGDTTFIRDLTLDITTSPSPIAFIKADEADYNPTITSQSNSSFKPDLVVDAIRFEEVYGYSKNVIVFPICNKGNGPTPEGVRIEGTVYAPGNYLRDFIIKKELAPGKCFEQVFSAKRDLRINNSGNIRLRIELDMQNAIQEERENNNADSQSILIPEAIDTNNQTISEETTSDVRRRILGLMRSRPNVARKTSSTQSRFRGFSSKGLSYKTMKKQETQKEEPVVGRSTGFTRTFRKSISANVPVNNIIREELPETPEDLWESTRWEREPYVRRFKQPRSATVNVAAPTKAADTEKRPTFRAPTEVLRPHTSYRGLRSGVRTSVDFIGQRSNNQPEFSTNSNFEVFCKDSDGINIFEKGTVEYKSRRMPAVKTISDETRGNYILEYYCEKDYMHRRLFKCEEVGDGMCVE